MPEAIAKKTITGLSGDNGGRKTVTPGERFTASADVIENLIKVGAAAAVAAEKPKRGRPKKKVEPVEEVVEETTDETPDEE